MLWRQGQGTLVKVESIHSSEGIHQRLISSRLECPVLFSACMSTRRSWIICNVGIGNSPRHWCRWNFSSFEYYCWGTYIQPYRSHCINGNMGNNCFISRSGSKSAADKDIPGFNLILLTQLPWVWISDPNCPIAQLKTRESDRSSSHCHLSKIFVPHTGIITVGTSKNLQIFSIWQVSYSFSAVLTSVLSSRMILTLKEYGNNSPFFSQNLTSVAPVTSLLSDIQFASRFRDAGDWNRPWMKPCSIIEYKKLPLV